LGRTPGIGIVTTGCTGISRLRRRVAPATLEMTKGKCFPQKSQKNPGKPCYPARCLFRLNLTSGCEQRLKLKYAGYAAQNQMAAIGLPAVSLKVASMVLMIDCLPKLAMFAVLTFRVASCFSNALL
jgi:hypothetical protein